MSTIDDLMSELDQDVLAFIQSPGKVDEIIAYLRKTRMMNEAGIKPKKGGEDVPKIDLKALGLVKEPPPIKRRI